ncbi:NADH dehydrogenase [ubiquinone] iron-sulfur protein 5 [Frankliniella fusca]|uniref:NADH dehydrogenase [ubiquinone] iron-sulfur protein 5 n=1 Tax=Frankliniella fusca TaxID=407009 RepID=A0AAE1LPV6_9NEOP|nr:NADH dehydrogenase [ubiquinone] iron-sulfur protein 5 [Frankliniella fusca]
MESSILRDNPLKYRRGGFYYHLMPLMVGPLWPSPLTDFTAPILSNQEGPLFCAQMEMMMLNCLEQYGFNRGHKMCGGYIQDLNECTMKDFERTRIQIMQEERRRKFRDGKLEKQYEECPPHI